MAKFSFDPESLKSMRAKAAEWGRKKQGQLLLALDSWALDVVGEMKQEIQSEGAVDQGTLLAATTKTKAVRQGDKLTVTVFNPMEYAVIVEFGRKPGGTPPPLLPLVAWAVRHGIISGVPVNVDFEGQYAEAWAASGAIMRALNSPVQGGRRSTKSALAGIGVIEGRKKKPMEPMTLAFLKVRLIARKIAREGTRARHPFSRVWDRKAATFKQDVSAYVKGG